MELDDWRNSNEFSHYKSLIKKEIESTVKIKTLLAQIEYLKKEISNDNIVVDKPPIGLKPKKIHDNQRQIEIVDAMKRYLEAGKIPPKEWAIELATYCE